VPGLTDGIAILYLGRIVEIGPSESIYADPKHPICGHCCGRFPNLTHARAFRATFHGARFPDAAQRPLGCSFQPRSPLAFEVCGWESGDLADLLERRWGLQSQERYEVE
jgi:oligopeptide/dipeptide ABC transporter ATP-binding protein